MERLIIFGIGPLANQIVRYMKGDDRYEIAAFTVEEKYIGETKEFCGRPVVAFESVTEFYPPSEYKFLVCIGYTQMNKVREKMFNECVNKGYEIVNYIHPEANYRGNKIGMGNILLPDCTVDIGTEIGNGNIFFPHAYLAHDGKAGSFNLFAGACAIAGDVTIGNNCYIGINSTIKDEVKIQDGTLIGASTYIYNNTKSWSVYMPLKSGNVSSVTMMKLFS